MGLSFNLVYFPNLKYASPSNKRRTFDGQPTQNNGQP